MKFFAMIKSLFPAFVVGFIGSVVLYIILEMGFDVTMGKGAIWFSTIAISVVALIFSYTKQGQASSCEKCGKQFAVKEVSRKITGSKATTEDIERTERNAKGEVIRRYTEAVPATCYYYDCIDECKFCGHRVNVKRYEIVRD